jgi:3-hydroxyisobutyrate dehydrogenase-like beta-hydroxyacid dehydrogenase
MLLSGEITIVAGGAKQSLDSCCALFSKSGKHVLDI